MTKPKITIISIGHVDHGKSTLVGRLLYDCKKENVNWDKVDISTGNFANFLDQLEEERVGQMTIDVVHTNLETDKHLFEFIDAPGHKEFIKNMMTGASEADAAQLLISVKPSEGVQEQTTRHLFLAKLFGIKQLIVAVNKMDAVNYQEGVFSEMKEKISTILTRFGFDVTKIPFVPVGARLGENVVFKSKNMPWYHGKPFLETLEETMKPKEDATLKPLRFPIQDVYSFEEKEIAVGRIESGRIKVDQKVELALTNVSATVASIEKFGESLTEAMAGDSIGVIFKNVSKGTLSRGEVVSDQILTPKPTTKLTAQIYTIEDGLKVGGEISVRSGTNEVKGHLLSIKNALDPATKEPTPETEALSKDFTAEVTLALDQELVAEPFSNCPPLGRLILSKGEKPLAAGVVL